MDAETKIVNGAYRVDAQGELDLISRGDIVVVQAEAGSAKVAGAEGASMSCADASLAIEKGLTGANVKVAVGLLGKITLVSGPLAVGPKIEMDADSITLSVGPPEVGAQIKLSVDGITVSYGLASFKLSPLGVEEEIGATTRKLSLLGNELNAAETAFKVGPEGITTKAPIKKEQVLGVVKEEATLVNAAASAIQKTQNGLEVH